MLPAGYERLLLGHAIAVARSDIAPSVRAALLVGDGTRSTLYEFAARQHDARALQGRGPAFAFRLPGRDDRVVVRHNRHGGLFARLTGDRFLFPTRAPRELAVSIELTTRGVPTPDVLAYVLYPPGGLLQRADVCSREIASGRDLAEVLMRDERAARTAALERAALLVAALGRAGARHHDLNARNILLAGHRAYVLDVDRVALGVRPRVALDANLARLGRSLRKWRDRFGTPVTEAEIGELAARARAQL